VADTADTAAGPQHPTFSYDLAGNGDVILTDVGARHEGVLLPAGAPEGSYFLVDARGVVAAEISKAAGVEARVALVPGPYKVKRRLSDRLRVGELTVRPNEVASFDEASLKDAPFADDPVKGLGLRRDLEDDRIRFGLGVTGGYQYFFAGPFPSMPLIGVEAALRAGFVWTLDFAYGFGSAQVASTHGDAGLPYRFNELGLGVSMTREFALGPVSPFLGARLAVVILGRAFTDAGVPDQSFFAMTPGLTAGLRLKLGRHFSVMARARAHYLYYNVDSQQSLGYLEGALLLSAEL